MADHAQTAILELPHREVTFTVTGHPMPAGSKKGLLNPQFATFKHGVLRLVNPGARQALVIEDSKNKPWRAAVAAAGTEARAQWGAELSDRPLQVKFVFYRARPLAHYGTGRNADTLKTNAPEHPTTRPDVLKLARAVEDSLTGVLWHDDAQIVNETLQKRWGTPERVEITVREL